MIKVIAIENIPEVVKVLRYAETRINRITGYDAKIKIENLAMPNEPNQELQKLINIVTAFYNVSWLDIISKNRQPEIITARYAFVYLANKKYGYGKSKIGRMVLRDHSTIMYAIDQVKDWISVQEPIEAELQTIIAKLNETKN